MKRQTLILVVIGVVLFGAGGLIAYASVQGAAKTTGSGSTGVAPVSMPAVVATTDIPAGTTGQAMVAGNMVAIEPVPAKEYSPTDLGSLAGLSDEVLTGSVTKGHAISVSQLTASTSGISVPSGDDAIAVSIGGTEALAGYLQPGAHIDVYANITKLSSSPGTSTGGDLPCTELAMTNIDVLDVTSTVPSYAGHASAGARVVPGSETLLLAVDPSQARTLEFLSQNESISVVQTQKGTLPPVVGQCIGTSATVSGS